MSMTEKQFSTKVLTRLDPHFEVLAKEFYGTYKERKGKARIDAIIKPRDITNWKRKDVVFGIEFKSPDTMRGIGSATKVIVQAYSYGEAMFQEYGNIPVIICPSIKGGLSDEQYALAARVLGKFNILELKNTKTYGYSIWHNGSHVIWSEKYGVKDGKRMNFIRQRGNTKSKN